MELIRPENDILLGRNVGYKEATRKLDQGKRDGSAIRWMCGVTRTHNIWNEHLLGTTRVSQASKTITKRMSNW